MPPRQNPPAEAGPTARHPVAQWAVLLGLTAVISALLEFARFPGAFLIGPMVSAVAAGVSGASILVPRRLFDGAQGIVGVLVASSISAGVVAAFIDGWYIFLTAIVGTLIASSALGWLIGTWRIMPGTTGVWGAAPGASTAMVLMASAFGADTRLVATMQYLRVIFVSFTAAVIAKLWVGLPVASADTPVWFPALDWAPFLSTVVVVVVGDACGRTLRFPSPCFLGAFVLAVALRLGAGLSFQVPEWLSAVSYTAIGWTIGLKFTRSVLMHAIRALPVIVASIIALMVVCGAIAWGLARAAGIDPLTAYLATSPGGLETVAIIAAASTNVDLSFVMALQTARFLAVLTFGPAISRFVAKHVRN